MLTLTRFSDSDWYGFAGARCFRDGCSPLIGVVHYGEKPEEGVIVIIDKEMCQFIDAVNDDQAEFTGVASELVNLLYRLTDKMDKEYLKQTMLDFDLKPWF